MMSRNILCRIIRSCFPERGLQVLDRKIAKIKRLKEKMERDNRIYYGETFYRLAMTKTEVRQ